MLNDEGEVAKQGYMLPENLVQPMVPLTCHKNENKLYAALLTEEIQLKVLSNSM